MMRNALYTLILMATTLLATTACQDEFLPGTEDIPEGTTTLNASISFRPMAEGLTTRTAGKAISEIEDLWVLVYDKDGNLFKTFPYTSAATGTTSTYVQADESRDNADAENNKTAESSTKCAKFKLELPYGYYFIYAVANMGGTAFETNYINQNKINTIEDLKNISLKWQNSTTSATFNGKTKSETADNNEMFGYFTSSTTQSETDPIVINSDNISLHAWVKRAASKVTVAFDASGLNESVYIYLKSVQIKDIPRNCFLGKDNQPGVEISTTPTRDQIDSEVWADGEMINYSTDASYANWPRIAKGLPYYYYGATDADRRNLTESEFKAVAHSETQNALFFYENMQGQGESKRQDALNNETGEEVSDGKLDYPGHPEYPQEGDNYRYKDNKPFGSYIEVKAYYSNTGKDVSSGEITYRFMLGMDTEKDYNAKRNYHYKLTLKFKGDANDVDWHIEYHEESPSIYSPDIYYISYLYNQKLTLPVKTTGNLTKLEAEIIENHWYPTGAPEGTDEDAIFYSRSSVTNASGTNNAEKLYNGFLSLVKPRKIVVGTGYKHTDGNTINENLWNGNGESINGTQLDATVDNRKRGYRKYTLTGESGEDAFTVQDAKNGGKIFNIPFFTRSKTLTSTTGYTGNNIFTGYTRSSKVKFTATFTVNGQTETRTSTTEIIQVKRLVNPKGIWRKEGSTEHFDVVLMEEDPNAATDDFIPVESQGAWKAYAEAGQGLIQLSQNGVVSDTVRGSTLSQIVFRYTPTAGSGVRCGIIRIDYNDFTCVHRIFVRQGYAPLALGNGKKWHTFNLYAKNDEVDSPLDEGSLFKVGNLDDAILSSNNLEAKYPFLVELGSNKLALAGNTSGKLWTDGLENWNVNNANNANNEILPNDHYLGNESEDLADFTNYKYNGATIAEFDDWDHLKNYDDGFGVLYADGTTEVQTDLEKAYEYGLVSGANGMRGCFVYDIATGNNLFFPIGATGYGRRLAMLNARRPDRLGSLRYGGWHEIPLPASGTRPFLFDLQRHQGAIYWCKGPKALSNKPGDKYYAYEYVVTEYEIDSTSSNRKYKDYLHHRAWDINYHLLGFNTHKSDAWPDFTYEISDNPQLNYYDYAHQYGSDACFIRLVEP